MGGRTHAALEKLNLGVFFPFSLWAHMQGTICKNKLRLDEGGGECAQHHEHTDSVGYLMV